ncbi:MAG TPA: YkgJ family cysteine cluster protein [Rhodocyclaceae bacterium]|nr:YkgJ family cysteine cluster protein [Rhodocyclaceae bacterium]
METTRDDSDQGAAVSCAGCEACCCRLEVLLMGEDDVPPHLTMEDRWGGWVMGRGDDGWCTALDRNTLRCFIYERRPGLCRDFEVGASECLGERSRLLQRKP